MDNEMPVVETIATPVVDASIEAINAQKADFKKQLDLEKNEMVKLQQQFEARKIRGTKLEGAIESLDILLNSLTK